MAKKPTKISFDSYYQGIYSSNWSDIKKGLLREKRQVIQTCFDAPILTTERVMGKFPIYLNQFKGIHHRRNKEGLKQYYIMDAASILCAEALSIASDDSVLDMCAAPGGKTLVLLQSNPGELWANEISKSRRERLTQVIKDYVPFDLRQRVFVKGRDGLKFGLQTPDYFSKILLDAPCSSERHLLKSPKEMAKWSPKRTKILSKIQYGLLCSALLACKKEGEIVYSTCSLSPLENDEVIRRVLERKKEQAELVRLDLPGFTNTELGQLALPHQNDMGPLYVAKLRKL